MFFLSFQLLVKLRNDKNIASYIFWATVICLSLLGGFRWGVGNDFYRYLDHYDEVYDREFREPLYRLTLTAAHRLGNFRYFLFLSSLIINYGFLLFIREFSRSPFLGYLLYFSLGVFYFGSWNLIRQYISISIFLINIVHYNRDNRLIRWFFLTLISAGFHLTGLVSLIIPMAFSWKKWYIYIVSGIIAVILINNIENIIQLTPYWIYLDNRWEYSMNNSRNVILIYSYIFSLVLAFVYVLKAKNLLPKALVSHFLIVSGLLVFLGNFLGLPNTFFYRINNYFLPVLLVVISSIKMSNLGLQLMFRATMIVISLFYLVYLILIKGPTIGLFPYSIY